MDGKHSETRRKVIEGSTLGVGVIMALVLFGMLNYLAHRHYQRFDWTSSQLYSLSEKSRAIVADLDQEIEAVIFLSPASEVYAAVDELLTRYEAANPRFFKKRVIDPAKNLLAARRLVEQYQIERSNVIVIATEDDRRVIDEYDLAEYDYSGAQYGQPPTLKEFKGEQQITSAILALVEARKPRILFTTGHGEAPLEDPGTPRSLSQAQALLGRDNFEIEEWSSLGKLEVPPDADLVVIAGATTNLLEPELEVLKRYLDAGGRMLLLLDPAFSGTELVDLGLDEWLAGYGIAIGDDIVIDPENQLPFFGAETIFTDSYGFHPIVESLEQTRTRVLFPLARSVGKHEEAPGELEITELVKTSSSGWGETNLAALDQVGLDDDDVAGPVPLGVAVSFKIEPESPPSPEETDLGEADPETPEAPDAGDEEDLFDPDAEMAEGETAAPSTAAEGRLVVFGDLDFASDAQIANAANSVLLVNTLNWLVKREQLIAIEGRRPQETRLSMSGSELSVIWLVVLIILPGMSVILGISVFIGRRR